MTTRAFSMELGRLAADWKEVARRLPSLEHEDRIEFIARADRLLADVKSGVWVKTRCNVFDVLGRPRIEDAHSSALAWLMDPAESHGLGDKFLRAFFKRCSTKCRAAQSRVR